MGAATKTINTMLMSAFLIGILAFGMFHWSIYSEFAYFIASQSILSILGASFVAGFPHMLAQTFPAEVRYSGNGIVLNMASGCFAGITPFLLTFIHQVTGSAVMPAVHIILSSLLALSGLFLLRLFYKK